MSWIRTVQKPVKVCMENPDFPLSEVFRGHDWERSGGTKQAGILAAAFILASNVDTIIEIGVWQGFTSHILGKALAANSGGDGLLLSVDISDRNMQKALVLTKDLPISHLGIVSDSITMDYYVELGERPCGLAFIDGDHEYEYCAHDLYACYAVLEPYGVMIVHDYSKVAHPGVYRAVNEFVEQTRNPMFFLDENRESTDYRTAILQKRGNY